MDVTIDSLIKDCSKLISFPDVAIRVNNLVNDPKSTAADIGKVISQDPALTTALLKAANSPLFGLSRKVDTVTRAITVLGTKQIRDLTLAASTAKAFKNIPNDLISMDQFWYHSLCCALAAQELAHLAKLRHVESVFIAGLLHDIGQLIIFNKVPDLAVKSLMLSLDEIHESGLPQAERDTMGFDHAQLGGELVKLWHLPESLHQCIAYHHEPSKAESHQIEVTLVHIANSIACLVEINSTEPTDAPAIEPSAWQSTGLDASCIPSIIAAVNEKIEETQSALALSA